MSPTRQDAWTQDEDLLLAEIVLRAIREGGTQLQAFEEVGKQLSRTSAACGFRWNSYVRKQYKSGIELAKKQRKDVKKQSVESNRGQFADAGEVEESFPQQISLNGSITFQSVIHYLEDLQKKAENFSNIQKVKEKSSEKIRELEKKTYYLAAENEKLVKNLKEIEADYHALMEIMERARKLVVSKEESRQ
ncbi:MAG TPA: RsfA family transcriptional regulator [Bacillales bacterium]|nr:RsfA family transcriptional regulator [Bacillales bacterium]